MLHPYLNLSDRILLLSNRIVLIAAPGSFGL